MNDGPFITTAQEDISDGVFLKEVTVYKVRDGMIVKEVATRRYMKDGDYHDTSSVTPLKEVKPNA